MKRWGVDRPHVADRYCIIGSVGSGGYSHVHKARNVETGEIVALKYVRTFAREMSIPQAFYRENACLRDPLLQCENIVKLIDVVNDNGTIVMVLEYCEFDLKHLIQRQTLTLPQVYSYAKQLFTAVERMHANSYVHRDLKPANILVTKNNQVKLADFGLSRVIKDGQTRNLTNHVVTPFYRAPELLLGDPNYGKPVDMWSLGCVLYEMITGRQLFKPTLSNSICELDCIFKVCGTPTVDDWPEIHSLPNGKIIEAVRVYPSVLEEILESTLPVEFIGAKDLIVSLLQLNPSKRMTIDEALNHPFFSGECDDLPELLVPETAPRNANHVSRAVIAKIPAMMRLDRVLPPPIIA